MAYFAEFSQEPDEGFYAEFVIVNKNTGGVIAGDGIDHQFQVYGWSDCDDYGFWGQRYQVVASNSNGMITAPERGVVAVAIPPQALFGGIFDPSCGAWTGFSLPSRNQVLRFKLAAVPQQFSGGDFDQVGFSTDAGFAKTLVKGTISFGDRVMPCPRFQLGVYPLYPNSQSASAFIGGAQVAQVKQQLAKQGLYDAVEAALAGPLDPATLSWTTGGTIVQGGPLSNVIARVAFNSDPVATGLFLAAASTLPI